MDMLDREVNKTLIQILQEMHRMIRDQNIDQHTDQLELLCKTSIALAKGDLTEVGVY